MAQRLDDRLTAVSLIVYPGDDWDSALSRGVYKAGKKGRYCTIVGDFRRAVSVMLTDANPRLRVRRSTTRYMSKG